MQDLPWLTRGLPEDARAQLNRAGDLASAWRRCPRAEWLLQLALSAHVGRATVVRATAALVSEAVSASRGQVSDLRIQRALTTARGWTVGRSTAKEAWAHALAAEEGAEAMRGAPAEVARAVAYLAFSCDEAADPLFYAHQAYPARAAAAAAVALGDAERAADRIRAELPLAAFLEAVELRVRERLAATPPPPSPESGDSFYC